MTRRFCWICTVVGTVLALALGAMLLSPVEAHAKKPIRVLAWSERTEPADVYPDGINGAIAAMFQDQKDVTVRLANLRDENQGLSDALLADTDVLVWFGHRNHKDVTQENVDLVVRHVKERGLGFLPLHSAHYAKPFQQIVSDIAVMRGQPLEGIPGKWGKVTNAGKPESVRVLAPKHPIAKGVQDFTIPKTEIYGTPFNVPAADLKVLESTFEGGPADGMTGLLWQYGKGKVFYFGTGHETYPIFLQPEVQRVLANAVRFLASGKPVRRPS